MALPPSWGGALETFAGVELLGGDSEVIVPWVKGLVATDDWDSAVAVSGPGRMVLCCVGAVLCSDASVVVSAAVELPFSCSAIVAAMVVAPAGDLVRGKAEFGGLHHRLSWI